MTGAEIIKRAEAAQKARDGVRVKVRVPRGLWDQVKACAAICKISTEEYVCSVCRAVSLGWLITSPDSDRLVGTREDSATVWVRVPTGFDTCATNLRAALSAGVSRTMSRTANGYAHPGQDECYVIVDDW